MSFRWSFVPHFAWGSIESTTILTTHPSLQTHLSPLPDFPKSWLFQLQFPTRLSRVCLLSWFCPDFLSSVCRTGFYLAWFWPLSGLYPGSLSGGIRQRQSCPDFRYPCLPTSASNDMLVRIFLRFTKFKLRKKTETRSCSKFWEFVI